MAFIVVSYDDTICDIIICNISFNCSVQTDAKDDHQDRIFKDHSEIHVELSVDPALIPLTSSERRDSDIK